MIKYIAFLLLIAALAACGEEDAYPLKSKFVIVNAAPAAAGLNVFTDNSKLDITPLTYPNHTVIDINSGKREVKIGATIDELLFDSVLYLVENRNYSLYFINAPDKVEYILRRDTVVIPAANKARIRFIHLSPDAPAVSFSAYGQSDTLEQENLTFKNFPVFAEVDAGNYTIGFSVNNNGGPTYLPDSSVLDTGKIYTVYLHGLNNLPAGSPQSLGLTIIENN